MNLLRWPAAGAELPGWAMPSPSHKWAGAQGQEQLLPQGEEEHTEWQPDGRWHISRALKLVWYVAAACRRLLWPPVCMLMFLTACALQRERGVVCVLGRLPVPPTQLGSRGALLR